MASELYREGKGHFVDGNECEVAYVEAEQFQEFIDAGWSTVPPGGSAPKSVSVDHPEDEVTLGEDGQRLVDPADSQEAQEEAHRTGLAVPGGEVPGHLTADEVRQAAKDAKIPGWDTKRVKTLRRELEEAQTGHFHPKEFPEASNDEEQEVE